MDSTHDRNPVLSRYFSEIRAYPTLTREQEQALAKHIEAGCRASRDELVQSNLSFVVKVASEYRNLGVPFEDLLNEGNLGLIEAATRYDASKGTKFITYAIWWIRKSILKALSERSTLIRVPTYQMKKVREIRETERNLRRKLGRKPEREEISAKLDRSVTKVDQALQYALREVSLEHRVGQNKEQTISDYLVDDRASNAEHEMIDREDKSMIFEAMENLTEQEKKVVTSRYGLRGGGPRTLKQVGAMMKISRERVRQIEVKAKAKLRQIFDERRSVKAPDKPPRGPDEDATEH